MCACTCESDLCDVGMSEWCALGVQSALRPWNGDDDDDDDDVRLEATERQIQRQQGRETPSGSC